MPRVPHIAKLFHAILVPTLCCAQIARADLSPASTTQPSSEPTTQPDDQFKTLAARLDDPDFATRDAAQKSIEQLGASVEPGLLQLLQGNLSAEARARIQSALARIRDERAFGPSIITLHYKDAPLLNLLDDFAKQAGADMGTQRPQFRAMIKDRNLTLDLDHVNFWTALQAIENATDLHIRPGDGDGSLILDNMRGGIEPWSDSAKVAGPVLLMPESATWNILYARNLHRGLLNFQMMAMVEPKLHVVAMNNMRWLTECVDEKGHDLMPDQRPNFFGNFAGSGGPWRYSFQLGTNLKPVAGMGSKIARMKGNLHLTVQTDSQVFEVDNIPSVRNDHHVVGDSSMDITEVTSENNQWQVHFSIVGPMANRNGSVQQLISSIQLTDDKAQRLQQTSCAMIPQGNAMTLIVGFVNPTPGAGPPQKLRWELTTASREITVPFEIDNLDFFGGQ